MVSGAVLAGGRSVRFGRNKALENFRGMRLIDIAVESLRRRCDPVLVVANELDLYFDLREAVLVQDVIPRQGPLGGILTALLFSPHDWICVKATDMPCLVPELIDRMLEAREGWDAVVPVLSGKYEPLLALYHRRCCAAVAEVLEGGGRKIVEFYGKVRVREFAEEEWRSVDPAGLSFQNVNTVEDLKRIEWS